MTIETYRTEYRALHNDRKANRLTAEAFVAKIAKLNERYFEGKGSFVIPMVFV